MRALFDDWREHWLSLALGVSLVLVFSQGWQAPLFGYGEDAVSESGLIRAVYLPFYVAVLALLWLSWRGLGLAFLRTPILLALIGLCAVSALWSIDASATLRRVLAMGFTTLAGYALACRFEWKRLTEVLALSFVLLAVASILLAVAVPELGRMQSLFVGAWRGLWVEKNNLGGVMGIGAIASAAAALQNPDRRWIWAPASAVMAALVLLSTSKTSLMALMVGVGGIGFMLLARRNAVTGIVITWLAVTALMGLGAIVVLMPELVFTLLGKDATLTGRTHIWEGIEAVTAQRPWLGWGYGVVWSVEDDWAPLRRITQIAGFRAYHAHSSWYEVMLDTGLVGLTLWSVLFAKVWALAFWRGYQGTSGLFALPFIAMFGLSSLTESITLGWHDLRWVLLVMVLVKLALPGDQDWTFRPHLQARKPAPVVPLPRR